MPERWLDGVHVGRGSGRCPRRGENRRRAVSRKPTLVLTSFWISRNPNELRCTWKRGPLSTCDGAVEQLPSLRCQHDFGFLEQFGGLKAPCARVRADHNPRNRCPMGAGRTAFLSSARPADVGVPGWRRGRRREHGGDSASRNARVTAGTRVGRASFSATPRASVRAPMSVFVTDATTGRTFLCC